MFFWLLSLAIECPVLENPPNGMVVVSVRTVGSIAEYTCLSEFTLIGVTMRECQLDEQWSDQEPTCESELYSSAPLLLPCFC